jgi:hypothetical protein
VALADPDRALLAEHLGDGRPGVSIEDDGGAGRYRVDGLTPSPSVVSTLAAWCEARGALIVDLRTSGGTLEERYLELIGAEAGNGETADEASPAWRARGGAREDAAGEAPPADSANVRARTDDEGPTSSGRRG